MAGMLDDRLPLFRLLSIINFVGRSFFKTVWFYVGDEKLCLWGERLRRKKLSVEKGSWTGMRLVLSKKWRVCFIFLITDASEKRKPLVEV